MRKRKRNHGPRYRPLLRALKLLVTLCRSRFGLGIPDLLEEAECSRRTLYRYLAALDEAGVKIETILSPLSGRCLRRVTAIDGRRIGGAA